MLARKGVGMQLTRVAEWIKAYDQQSLVHNNSHVNQIGTITGSSHSHKGNVLSISSSVNKTNSSEWILE